jgi:hypothetical protein
LQKSREFKKQEGGCVYISSKYYCHLDLVNIGFYPVTLIGGRLQRTEP